MNWKGYLIFMLCLAMTASCLFGCNSGQDVPESSSVENTAPTMEATLSLETEPVPEDRLPEISGDSVRMYYDDRLDIAELTQNGSAEVEISQQEIASRVVGTQDKDDSVIYYHSDSGKLIATGTGTAVVTIDGKAYSFTVEAAPISMFFITGHSIGAGQTGVKAQSVLCADGQAYSSHGFAIAQGASAEGVGIGFASGNKPKDIDAFTSSGEGVIGEGSALAWKWNQLTGEKVWVVNGARGGSCLNEWAKGQEIYEDAVGLFRYAQTILANEIVAGHYRLKDMVAIYHSAANYAYKGVTYTREQGEFWYTSMWNGLQADLTMDMTGDGQSETVQAMGFVPIWSGSGYNKTYENDKAANFFMGATDCYSNMFMASLAARTWNTDANVRANFPEITYKTHGELVTNPLTTTEVYTDGVHYTQVAYNAAGLDIAQNLYSYLRTVQKLESLSLVQPDGNKLYDEIKLKVGSSVEIVPVVEPLTIDDLSVTLSDNLSLSFPSVITANNPGTGTLTISCDGEVLKTITFIIE